MPALPEPEEDTMKTVNRRDFFRSTAIAGLGTRLFTGLSPVTFGQSKGSRPLVVSSANGLRATAKAMEMIRAGKDTLDAVVAGVAIVEDDPKDMSVGYGGLPNEDGVVELDASVMHGPSKRAGAVASLQRIKNPAQVAKAIMERTDHVLLCGPGALRFAVAQGFKEMDLLTEEARIVWLRWKERMSDDDAWGPGLAAPDTSPTQSKLYDGTPIRPGAASRACRRIYRSSSDGNHQLHRDQRTRRHFRHDDDERAVSQTGRPRRRFAVDRLRLVR